MKKISLKAMVAGGIVHYVLGRLLLALPIIYVLLPLRSDELNLQQLGDIFLNAIAGTRQLPYLQIAAAFASALIAGYIAARLARKDELLNGCLAALPCSALMGYRMMTNENVPATAIDILVTVAAFAFALLGGFLAQLRSRSTAAG